MKWTATLCSLVVVTACFAEEQTAVPTAEAKNESPGFREIIATPTVPCCDNQQTSLATLLQGDRAFPNFMGYVSNPTRAIDPRALTQMMPIFNSAWVPNQRRIPSGDMQVYGPALSIAAGERFSFGASQGGYAMTSFNRNRDGWIDLGLYAQYALIRDVENQFIFTVGMQVITPWLGSTDLNQGGAAPPSLAPYFTFGKELGNFHVLGTLGYKIPTGEKTVTTRSLYGTLHFDRQCFGWLYPLVEFNGAWNEHKVNAPRLDAVRGFFDLGNFDAAGSMLTVAPGFNAVIIRDRLELGAVYQTPIVSENNFRFHAMLVKMVLRY